MLGHKIVYIRVILELKEDIISAPAGLCVGHNGDDCVTGGRIVLKARALVYPDNRICALRDPHNLFRVVRVIWVVLKEPAAIPGALPYIKGYRSVQSKINTPIRGQVFGQDDFTHSLREPSGDYMHRHHVAEALICPHNIDVRLICVDYLIHTRVAELPGNGGGFNLRRLFYLAELI